MENASVSDNLIPAVYLKQAQEALKSRENLIQHLLQHRKIPDVGWNDSTIEYFLMQLSSMDSNNFIANCGLGEREARVASVLVAKRHYYMAHGIGRSGDLTESQPKAAGSSLMYKLTNQLLEDLFKLMGINNHKINCLLVPIATGMSITLCLLSFKLKKPQSRYVIWSRIDQKSCFKSIVSAGLTPVIVDPLIVNDELTTDIELIESKIKELGVETVCCVISTTSCFAPRGCDAVDEIAVICDKYNVNHLINNAYGLQSKYLMRKIQKAKTKGRVDVFVQSADKNLMVPVGGAILAAFDGKVLKNIASTYPGRASASCVLDVLITLLSLGKEKYLKLVENRNATYNYLHGKLKEFARKINEDVIAPSENPISIAVTLRNLNPEKLTMLGSMMFIRCISGCRVVTGSDSKTVDDYRFNKWGCHSDKWKVPYFTAASSIGLKNEEIDVFIKKLEKIYCKCDSN